MRRSLLSRVAAIAAVAVLAIAVVAVLVGSSEDYTVTAEFENASLLVTGNQVVVGGLGAGSVESIELGDRGQALVELSIDGEFAPLHRGTVAAVRVPSQSSIAGRQVQLTLPANGAEGEEIPSGGSLTQAETVSAVNIDQLFNLLDDDTVEDLKRVIQGLSRSYEGVGEEANEGFRYLSPFLSTGRRLFSELTRDERALERLIVDSSELSGAVATRAPDLAQLVANSDVAFGALARQRGPLAASIAGLPDFMRQANTTFVNLRAALDDVDPLVAASRPAARALAPFMSELRAATRNLVPAIQDMNPVIRRPGAANDLVDLANLQVPLRRAAIGSGRPDCGNDPTDLRELRRAADDDYTQGAFGEAVCALRNSLPQLSMFRAYTPELVGWFDDFGHSGVYDATGGIGRIGTTFNTWTFSILPGLENLSLQQALQILAGVVGGVLPPDTAAQQQDLLVTDQTRRCPGANERDPGDGSTPFTDGGRVNCDPNQTPTGP